MASDRSGGRQDRPFVRAVTRAAHAVPTGRLTHLVTGRTASPNVVRTLRELGIEIMTT
jgi:hypothetical protein